MYREEAIPDPDDDDEAAPSYFDTVGIHRRHNRRSSTSKGVEFDLPEEDENAPDDAGNDIPLPRLVRSETVPGSTTRFVGRELRASRHASGASGSSLHPYVRVPWRWMYAIADAACLGRGLHFPY